MYAEYRLICLLYQLLSCFSSLFISLVCSVRVIGESDIIQEFLSESDEVCISFIFVLISTRLKFKVLNFYLNFDNDLYEEKCTAKCLVCCFTSPSLSVL